MHYGEIERQGQLSWTNELKACRRIQSLIIEMRENTLAFILIHTPAGRNNRWPNLSVVVQRRSLVATVAGLECPLPRARLVDSRLVTPLYAKATPKQVIMSHMSSVECLQELVFLQPNLD